MPSRSTHGGKARQVTTGSTGVLPGQHAPHGRTGSLGVAVGQPTWIAESDDGDVNEEAGFAWELFYKFQVTDNISVTPAITYLSKPYPEQGSNGMSAFSGLIKTQFKF